MEEISLSSDEYGTIIPTHKGVKERIEGQKVPFDQRYLARESCLTEVDEHFICVCCYDVVMDPKECSVCQHLYCSKCFNGIIRSQWRARCAFCRSNLTANHHINTYVREILEKYVFECECCQAKVPYEGIQKHWKECQINLTCKQCKKRCSNQLELVEHFLTECPHTETTCTECGHTAPLKDQESHVCGLNFLQDFDEFSETRVRQKKDRDGNPVIEEEKKKEEDKG